MGLGRIIFTIKFSRLPRGDHPCWADVSRCQGLIAGAGNSFGPICRYFLMDKASAYWIEEGLFSADNIPFVTIGLEVKASERRGRIGNRDAHRRTSVEPDKTIILNERIFGEQHLLRLRPVIFVR